MFERFIEGARQVVVLAQEEARLARHRLIGTEHVLLGLLRVEDSVTARTFAALRLEIEDVRADVLRAVPPGPEPVPTGRIPFTPRATRVIQASMNEAQMLGANYVGPAHILLALVREGAGVAARVLRRLGVDGDAVRAVVLPLLRGRAPAATGGVDWPASVLAAVAAEPPGSRPSVRITLADGERFLLESFEPVDSEGLLGLAVYPDAGGQMIDAGGAEPWTPRLVIVRPAAVGRAEVLPQAAGGRERGFHGLRAPADA